MSNAIVYYHQLIQKLLIWSYEIFSTMKHMCDYSFMIEENNKQKRWKKNYSFESCHASKLLNTQFNLTSFSRSANEIENIHRKWKTLRSWNVLLSLFFYLIFYGCNLQAFSGLKQKLFSFKMRVYWEINYIRLPRCCCSFFVVACSVYK